MELHIIYKDDEAEQPQLVMEGNKVKEIIIKAPFIFEMPSERIEDYDDEEGRSLTTYVSGTKLCKKCNVERHRDEYHPHRTNKDGTQGYCIGCMLKIRRTYNRKKAAEKKGEAQK
jgi:hypothetical protein